MFKINPDPTFEGKVKVKLGDDPTETFTAKFAVISNSAQSKFDLSTPEGTQKFLQQALVAASDLADEVGDPLTFTEEIKATLIDMPHTRAGLLRAYMAGITGAISGN